MWQPAGKTGWADRSSAAGLRKFYRIINKISDVDIVVRTEFPIDEAGNGRCRRFNWKAIVLKEFWLDRFSDILAAL